jgi:hypothetical protein
MRFGLEPNRDVNPPRLTFRQLVKLARQALILGEREESASVKPLFVVDQVLLLPVGGDVLEIDILIS